MLDAYLPFFATRYGTDMEFLIVINGTTDRTEDVVSRFEQRYPIVRHIVEPRAIGKGGALMMGFAAAKGDLVGFADADGSTPPEAFQDLVDHIGDAGVLIASRWCRGAKVSPPQPLSRRVASRVFNILTKMLFGRISTRTRASSRRPFSRCCRTSGSPGGRSTWTCSSS